MALGTRSFVGSAAVCAALAVSFGIIPGVARAQSSTQHSPQPKNAMSAKGSPVQPGQKTFSTAAEAAKTLVAALQSNDQAALLGVLGPDAKGIISSGDNTEDKNDRDQFVQKYQQMHRLVMEPNGTTTLYIGAENWPSPIPLMHGRSGWYFDTAAGKEEILYRRVGKNELAAIEVCHELVDAEKEYYGQPHDGDSGKKYAQKFFSDPGKHNGLYWKTSSGETDSPIGPLVAFAASDGYTPGANEEPQPFQGYYFHVLAAPAGGFAFLVYPAEYRSSGVMTFLVNQDGIVYEKDLGPKTAEIAKSMTRYARDASWRKSD